LYFNVFTLSLNILFLMLYEVFIYVIGVERVRVLTFLMQLRKYTKLSMQHFIGSILQASYLYFPKRGRISIMSKTNRESKSNDYY
jgi:hypothetical protein